MHTRSSVLSDPYRELEDGSETTNPLETVRVSQEEPWDKQGENLLRDWLATAKQQAIIHRKHGFKLKGLYKFYGVLSIISAGFVFLCSNVILSGDEYVDTTVKVFIAFVNLVIVNLVNFLDYGPKYKTQFEFEGKYAKVGVDIDQILAIDREFRSPKDRTLAEYKEKMGNLFVNAPEV